VSEPFCTWALRHTSFALGQESATRTACTYSQQLTRTSCLVSHIICCCCRLLCVIQSTNQTCRYCGGTEIGGGFLAGCMWRPQAASAFATPSLGSQLVLLTDHGQVRLPCDTKRSIVG
jgi:hypothetical protein